MLDTSASCASSGPGARRVPGHLRSAGAPAAAAAWSLAYAALALFWALGGGGFPFGSADREAADMGSIFVGLTSGDLAGPISALCGAAAAVATCMTWRVALPRPLILTTGWAMTTLLLLVVPDVRLMRDFAYLLAGADVGKTFGWSAANQLICVAGGLLWGSATIVYQRHTRAMGDAAAAPLDAARWARRGRWATIAAIALPVPYELTRWAWALGVPLGVTDGAEVIETWSARERIGMLVIGALPLVGGLLTHGLTRPWGERLPRCLPVVGNRPIPVGLVVVPAALAAIVISAAGTSLLRMSLNVALGRVPPPTPDVQGWGAWAPGLLWLPWGLALGIATYAYWRRRRAADAPWTKLAAKPT